MRPDTVILLRKMLLYICAYQEQHETTPSQAEISEAIGRSQTWVARLIDHAISRGWVSREYGARRRIKVLDSGRKFAAKVAS